MAYEGKYDTWTVVAKNDLSDVAPGSGALFKAIDIQTGDFASSGARPCFMLEHGCSSGGNAAGVYFGITKGTFISAINSIGMDLTVTTSGYLTLAASGNYVYGKNLTTVACGVHPIMWNGINPWYYNPTENSSGS